MAVTDDRIFWKTLKPFLSEKVTNHSKINLVEVEKNISCDNQSAEAFSEYFIINSNFKYARHGYEGPNSLEPDLILRIIDKYRDNRRIKLIKAKNNSSF